MDQCARCKRSKGRDECMFAINGSVVCLTCRKPDDVVDATGACLSCRGRPSRGDNAFPEAGGWRCQGCYDALTPAHA